MRSSRLIKFLRREINTLIFALGTLCDVIFIAKGGLEHNVYFSYAAVAGMGGNMLMMTPRLIEWRRGKQQADLFARKMKVFAGTWHNTAGLGMILSGFGLGHTGFTWSEIFLGLFSSLGSIAQFWGDEILIGTGLKVTRIFSHLHGGRLALLFYTPTIPSVFADAGRLQSPLLFTAGCAALCVITLLWNRELHNDQS